MFKKNFLKNTSIKIVSLMLIMSFFLPLFYSFTSKKAEAGIFACGASVAATAGVTGAATGVSVGFAAISVPTFSLPEFITSSKTMLSTSFLELKEGCLDGIVKMITQIMIRQISASIVTWINSGFEGGPGFITNPKDFFINLANDVSGEFITGAGLSFLCSPFKLQIQMALAFSRRQNFARKSQCTLKGILDNVKNFNAFVEGDFSVGGWDGWFSMTQNPQNNPYGAYIMASAEMGSRMVDEVGVQKQKLDWGKGFFSWETCEAYEQQYFSEDYEGSKPKPECIKKKINTPGSVVESQINQVLPKELEGLMLADEIDEIIGALMGQLLNKVMTGIGGLSGASQKDDSGKSFIDNWQDEGASVSLKTKESIIKSIDKSIKTLQNPKYTEVKKETVAILQTSEDMLNSLIACYNTKLTSNYSLSEQRRVVATQGIIDAQAILNPPIDLEVEPMTGIIPLKDKINAEILGIVDVISELNDIKKQIKESTTSEGIMDAMQKYNLFINNQDMTVQNAKSEKKSITSKLNTINKETKKSIKQCEKWGSASDVLDEGLQ